MAADNKEKAMAVITIDENAITKFVNEFSVKFAKMEMMIETLSRDIELLRKQIAEKQAENGKQDVSLAQIQTVCNERWKILQEVKNFKDKFIWMQIAGNIITIGIVFLIFKLFAG